MRRAYDHLFGPVPSRRLGHSLGVDLVPHKTCSFDCVFCQLGRTTRKTVNRREYVPTSKVIDELHDWIANDGRADFITLAGSGEPTLHSGFGDIIDFAGSSTTVPVALLTNGSTLGNPEVRSAAARADVVKVSLSAWDRRSFEHINRPCSDVSLKGIVEGMWMLRQVLGGQLWMEVFIVWGANSIPRDVDRISELAAVIQPDRIQLNTAVRPPAETFVQPVPEEHLARLAGLFDPQAEIIAEFDATTSPCIHANEATVLALLARRPCTVEQIANAFGMHRNEAAKYVGRLSREGQIQAQEKESGMVYLARQGRMQHAVA